MNEFTDDFYPALCIQHFRRELWLEPIREIVEKVRREVAIASGAMALVTLYVIVILGLAWGSL